jgi:hypothetical protein
MEYTVEMHAFRGIILEKSKLSADYTAERMPFRGIIRGKACDCELFCVKAGFSTVKSAESFDFSRTILRISREKSSGLEDYQ